MYEKQERKTRKGKGEIKIGKEKKGKKKRVRRKGE